MYKQIKRYLDITLSLIGIILLMPIFLIIMISIKIESRGPIFFKQKRVGINKTYFEILKFRTMRIDTPKDMPTHLLKNPEQYITRVGKFLRKTSLDELPQIINILKGDMSIVGPRPALWNQEDLIRERDKYGANDVLPGLTGWAQINGRDELEIPVKAKFDGEYVAKFSFSMDLQCLLGTIGSVLSHDGVVEGGTGALNKEENRNRICYSTEKIKKEIYTGVVIVGSVLVIVVGNLISIWKYLVAKWREDKLAEIKNRKPMVLKIIGIAIVFETMLTIYANFRLRAKLHDNFINKSIVDSNHSSEEENSNIVQKKILITGANSYVGMSVEAWLKKNPNKYMIDTIDMREYSWKNHNFSQYDVLYHVAGIAHSDISSVTEEKKCLYYKVNTELAVEVAKKAKEEGVRQFIFMSSMIVYSGCKEKLITSSTEPKPLNFYGDSKWQAEQRIQALANDSFKVVILRPPMIYGKGSKGNYLELAKLVKKIPIFPIVKNKRSMIHIDNFSQFVKLMIDNEETGVFFPQNAEYTSTSEMVQMIAEVRGYRIIMIPFTNAIVELLGMLPGKVGRLAMKAFGDFVYEISMSEYKEDYHVRTLYESIRMTER